MSMDLVLLVQTTINSLVSRRAAARGRTIVASRPGAAARVRASLAVLLLAACAACAAPPAPPVAVAAENPTDVPTPTAVPTAVPTLVPTPTDVPAPRYDLVLVGGTLIDATGALPLENAAIAIQGRHIVH